MPRYFCQFCQSETDHLTIKHAAEFTEVSRSTIYNWIGRGLVHGVLRPSGRRFVCTSSLLTPLVDGRLASIAERFGHLPAAVVAGSVPDS